jgi:hypothetical protein
LNWTSADIIKSKVAHINMHITKSLEKSENPTNLKTSPQKEWLELNLQMWANENCVELCQEYKFDKIRKWRFDWCFPALKIAVEYNGIMSKKSRHTTITGYSKDMEKINAAQTLGWRVLQYTPLNYKNVLIDLNKNYSK